MSKLVAFAAIQGGYKVVSTAEGELKKALETYNARHKDRVSQYRLLSSGHLFSDRHEG